jgi:hypothetical protein
MTNQMGVSKQGKKLGRVVLGVRSSRVRWINRIRPYRGARPFARVRLERRLRQSAKRNGQWQIFVEKFEQFTGVLCAAAQHGITQGSEQEYLGLRTWFLENYYEHAAMLRPHMGSNTEDSLAESAGSPGSAMDRFEAIFLPRTLKELLTHDDGGLISLVSRVSHAVYAVEI